MTISQLHNRNFANEFTFLTARSGGPGGQHVNKVSSKVELRFDVHNSQLLSAEEKLVVLHKLGNRINSKGVLQITVQLDRSQLKNKQLAIKKFYELIQWALTPRKPRKATRPTKASKEKRLESKKREGAKKALRRKPIE